MSKLFNYGSPGGNNGGWSEKGKYFEEKEIDKDIESSVIPRENPRVAVPSPFARLQIIQEAFENVSVNVDGRKPDDRDVMLVSQALDIMEFVYEGGIKKYNLSVSQINLKGITITLENCNNVGTTLLGRTLSDYADRENYGLYDNNVLYIIHRNGDPLAMTSPTSGWLPTPNYDEWAHILINGNTLPIFSVKRGLLDRNEGFVLCLYSWISDLANKNGGVLPEPLESFGKYLSIQEKNASHEMREKIGNAKKDGNSGNEYTYVKFQNIEPKIWNTPYYAISGGAASNLIIDQSDLRIASTVQGTPHPLVLTTNCIDTDLIYTSGQTKWDSRNPGFSYSDDGWKLLSVGERTTLPNGQEYADGFVYEHDFLADTIIQLPYKYNSDMFFDGNIEGLKSDEIGFIPPVKDEYFNYFTADDLRRNLHMVVYTGNGGPEQVKSVEVFLDVPTTKGRNIQLKKTYHMAPNIRTAITEVVSAENEATGLIAPNCGVALNTLPFKRAYMTGNYYAFQLLVDDFGFDNYRVWLNACTETAAYNSHDVKEKFFRYVRRTSKANGTPVITSYALDGGNFDYLKLSFGEKLDETQLSALLIPCKEIERYRPQAGRKLEFSFDFGTSNTFVAVRDDEGNFLDFKLPTDDEWMVSTISPSNGNVNDSTVLSFVEYGRQEFLPIFGPSRSPFPVSTVLAAPKFLDESPILEGNTDTNPMLTASIPFVYGAEDFGSQFNRIIANLKWTNKIKSSDPDYTACFINELMFLAQVFAMKEGADLSKCAVYWTYPLSMNKTSIKRLQEKWKNAFVKFFEGKFDAESDSEESDDLKVKSFPESMAPVLYLLNRFKLKTDTVVTVDIGGGTCDLVIVPDGKIGKLKASSIGFGAECIFGIKGKRASDVRLFKLAVKQITQNLLNKANSKDPEAYAFKAKAEELQKMMNEGRMPSEMSTYLFNLPNNPRLKKISKEISFNQWIQDHEYHHTVFIYYYAALMYYIADLWKSFPDIEKPAKIFFSGGGSKILNIVCGGESALLDEYTDELFNLFAADQLDDEQLDEQISVKREMSEPKQITAKGVLVDISGNAKLSEIKGKMLEWTKPSDRKEFQVDFKMLGNKKDQSISYGELENDDIIENVLEKIKDFHEKLMRFLASHEELSDIVADIENDFTNRYSTERKMRKAVRGYLESVLEESGASPDTEYADVPFIEVVKNFIIEAMAPESDIL